MVRALLFYYSRRLDKYIASIYNIYMEFDFSAYLDFEWDEWNIKKNLVKHRVTVKECEEAFADPKKRILHDVYHSQKEKRYILLGITLDNRILYIAFTVRNKRVRVISARDLNRKEKYLYYEEKT